MGGNDDDPRSDLDKWLDAQRMEADKIRQQFQDSLERELRSWNGRDSSSSASSPSSSSSPSSPPQKGPFERFKGFIDSNFRTFSDGFRNFPANVSELKAKMQQEREARRQDELEIWRRWTGSEDSPDHIKMQIERQSSEDRQAVADATYLLLREAYKRNKHVPPSKILELYRDHEWKFGSLDQFATPMLSMGGACYYKTETVENLPSTARWAWSSPKAQWLSVDWFRRSPYSPVRLEVRHDLETSGMNWRAAFEDLLCAALDKPMVSDEKVGQRIPYGKPQSTYRGPGLEWMLSLQCRGILPPQLPSLYRPVSLFDGFDEVNRPRTVEFMHDMDQITSKKQAARMYPGVKRDLHLLMDEIAIKSGPDTEAKPLRVVQTPWRVPETELELYEAMQPYTVLAEEPAPRWQPPRISGNYFEDIKNFEQAMWDALDENDLDRAAECLSTYYRAHNNVVGLVEVADDSHGHLDPDSPKLCHPEVMEALRRSDVPDSDRYKRDAIKSLQHTVKTGDTEELPAREPSKTVAAVAPMSENIKKPDVLSQLTTTHTTRKPDGTVITKVVLKQRFADGSEETHESVQTARGDAQVSDADQADESREPPKKKGWFWN